jgi:hypothetical protein
MVASLLYKDSNGMVMVVTLLLKVLLSLVTVTITTSFATNSG